jgi:predicted RNase H-like HicB family nuclease
MYEAISFHLEGMAENGLVVPESRSFAEFMVVPETAA